MNKTVIFVTFAILAALGLIGVVVLLVLGVDTDRIGTFTALFITVLSVVTTAAGTFYALGKQGQKLETIEKNTNGRLEAKESRIVDLEAQLREAGLEPVTP